MATFTLTPKNSTAFSLLGKAVTSFSNMVKRMRALLLKEDGFYLLTEDNGRIIIEPDLGEWNNLTKN